MLKRLGILALSILFSIPLVYALPPLVEFGNMRLNVDSPLGPILSLPDQQVPLIFTLDGPVAATTPILTALFDSPTSDIAFAAAGVEVTIVRPASLGLPPAIVASGIIDWHDHGHASADLLWTGAHPSILVGEVEVYELHVNTPELLILSPFAHDELIVGVHDTLLGVVTTPVFWY
jgi:hypothetical protein